MAGYKTWAELDILTAADLMSYLMTQAVPRFTTTTARDAAIGSPAAGQLCYVTGVGLLMWDGTLWAPQPKGVVGSAYHNASPGTTSTGVEVALTAWTASDTINFENSGLYRLRCSGCVYEAAGSATVHATAVRLRKGLNTIVGQQLALRVTTTAPGIGSANFPPFAFDAYVKNVSGAAIATLVGVTIQRMSGPNAVVLYGDAVNPLQLAVEHLGHASETRLSKLAAIAVAIV